MTTKEEVNGTTYTVEWEIEEVVETHGADFHEFALNGYVESGDEWVLLFQASGQGFGTDIEEIYDIEKV